MEEFTFAYPVWILAPKGHVEQAEIGKGYGSVGLVKGNPSPQAPPAKIAPTAPVKDLSQDPPHQEAADAYCMHSSGMHPSRHKHLLQSLYKEHAAKYGMDEGDMMTEFTNRWTARAVQGKYSPVFTQREFAERFINDSNDANVSVGSIPDPESFAIFLTNLQNVGIAMILIDHIFAASPHVRFLVFEIEEVLRDIRDEK